MDEMRDLARDDPWRASLERSLVRRRRASGPLGRASTRPPPAGSTEGLPPYWRLCWRAAVRRWPTLVAGAAGLAAILLLAAARPGVSDGENARAAEPAPG